MRDFCFVRGCEKLAKIEVLFSDRHGFPVCDKHIDDARRITYELQREGRRLAEEAIKELRDLGDATE